MPKIDAPEKLFFSLLGKTMTDDELVDIFPVAKAELDGHDAENKVLKIELNDTNRPDLWSPAGVARALRTYETGEIPYYDFFSTKDEEKDSGGRMIIDDESAKGIRDYSIGFACRGVEVDNDLLVNLIQSQEKLCFNFGRKRRTIAMGIYRSELINYPVHYAAVDPDKTKFVPLGMTEELSLREITQKHPKGKEYGYIVSSFDRFPYLYDDKGRHSRSRPSSIRHVSAPLRWVTAISSSSSPARFSTTFFLQRTSFPAISVIWDSRFSRSRSASIRILPTEERLRYLTTSRSLRERQSRLWAGSSVFLSRAMNA